MIKPFSLNPTKRPYREAVVLINCVLLFFSLQVAGASDNNQPALSATLEHRFDPTQQVFSRSSVLISADGYRVEGSPLDHGQVLIANTTSGKTWLVDSVRSLIHEVPYIDVAGAPELVEPHITLPGFLDSFPCNITGGTRVGSVRLKGRSLERWLCDSPEPEKDDELPVEQYFSSEYNLVLFSRSHSKFVSELVDIRESLVNEKLFSPPNNLHPVTIEQFMGEFQTLEHYAD